MRSAFFTVAPLRESVEKKIVSEDAERDKNGSRHRGLSLMHFPAPLATSAE
jgi:hypothetical protein